jgi:hypothetical protein
VIAFVRLGLVIKITSAQVTHDGTISTDFTLNDPQGLPLDRTGVTTRSPPLWHLLLHKLPQGQQRYVDDVILTATGPIRETVTQATGESNGVLLTTASGYHYTVATKTTEGSTRRLLIRSDLWVVRLDAV